MDGQGFLQSLDPSSGYRNGRYAFVIEDEDGLSLFDTFYLLDILEVGNKTFMDPEEVQSCVSFEYII